MDTSEDILDDGEAKKEDICSRIAERSESIVIFLT